MVGRRRIYLIIFFFLLLLFSLILLWRIGKRIKEREEILKRLEMESLPVEIDTLVYVLRRGETIDLLLTRVSPLTQSQRELVLKGLAGVGLNFRALQEGETLFLYQRNSLPEMVDYRKNYLKSFRVYLNPWRMAMPYRKKDCRVELVKGVIASSLYESILGIGERPELAVKFAEILEWDIDFWTEVQKGDSFIILTEKIYCDDQFFAYDKVLLAVYQGKIGKFYGINFQGNYYNWEGKALRRAFLKSPLRFSYISSRFSSARCHPILRVVRPHRGVDYVAPTGTPVSALGDGTITFAGWHGGYGRLVVIRHPNNYITKYGHLSGIKKGMRMGRKVKQGEIIGYVGSSGLATGPHLHFEILKNNSWVNPLKIVSPPTSSLPPELMAEFQAVRDSLIGCVKPIYSVR